MVSTSDLPQNIWDHPPGQDSRQQRRGQLIERILRDAKPQMLVDVGCAEGYLTSYVCRTSECTVAFDIEYPSLKLAHSKVNEAEFLCSSMTHIPMRDECADGVLLAEVLEHLPSEVLIDGLKEIDRILKKGGILLVTVPYRETILNTKCIHCGELTPIWGHLRVLDENTVAELLPNSYQLTLTRHLPNLEMISCSKLFKHLPYGLWSLLNEILGTVSRGYWVVMRFVKN